MKDIIGSFEKISMNVPPGALNPDFHRKKKGICESIIFSKRCEYTYLTYWSSSHTYFGLIDVCVN